MAVGDTILIKDISINGNNDLKNASDLSETLKDNTINAFGIDASSRTIWVNGQPYGNAYVNIKEDNTTIEAPIGAEIFNDFENNIASGEYSHAEGNSSKAKGNFSHAEGNSTNALGEGSHAEGKETKALGEGSHSEGKGIVSGNYIFSGPISDDKNKVYIAQYTDGLEIGDILIRERDNYAVYITAIDVDNKNVTFNNTFGPIVNQQLKKITGSFGQFSHSEGKETITNEHAAHAEGFGTKAFGQNSHAEGEQSKSFGKDSHAEGSNTVASGDNSHAEGADSTAGGPTSHAEGYMTEAKSSQSHAEGYGTIIDGDIEVDGTWIGPTASHAEGYLTKVIAQGKEGGLIANGQAAHVEGYMTEAHNLGEHAEGRLNVSHFVTLTNPSKPTEIELSQSTLHSVGMGFPDPTDPDNLEKVNRKNAHEIMQDGKHYIYGIGGYDGINLENSKDIATYLPNMVNITYKELVDLRKESNLVPGQQYRITDYITTTSQTGTKSAENLFDIIVTADSKNKLNEEARAIHSERDTDDYFKDSKLSAWKLWYCLDNDTDRFDWADNRKNDDGTEKGKGVIYRMIDEFGNDCPYDFKNIQFYRQQSDYNLLSTIPSVVDTSKHVACYTFSSVEYKYDPFDIYIKDTSLIASNNVYSNVIKEYINTNKQTLNNICFFGFSCYGNTFGNNCYNNTFGDTCYSNRFGNNCDNNIFGNVCSCNVFGNGCEYIEFATEYNEHTPTNYNDKYIYNQLGDGCKEIQFKSNQISSNTENQPQYIQNYKFAQGTSNIIIVGKRNREYETYISRDTDGAVKESVIAEISEKLDKMIEISYNDLVTLRSNSKLIPGQQYRITDYTCTTKQVNTQSANHQFDIIVTADSENKLNEEARAIQHTNDKNDYFHRCNLNAWKLWYCLDNDMDRFAWADSDNGRGVIYRMIDEFGNDCPYDFKNIQFYRQWDSSKLLWSFISSDDTGVPCYTFSSVDSGLITGLTTKFIDCSLDVSNNIYYNVIKEYKYNNKQGLNNICFFKNSCYSNTFGNDCFCTTFGQDCYSNIFGNNCNYNSFGNSCFYNSFGNKCSYNILGNNCNYNSFGNGCEHIKFASKSVDSLSIKYSYYRYNHFGDGCKRILFKGSENPENKYIQNYNFAQGVQYEDNDNFNYIEVNAERGLKYEIRVIMPNSTSVNPTKVN